MTCGIHQNDIGTTIKIQISDCSDNALDISSADTIQIVFKKPSGTSVTKTATFTTDGSDGLIQYIIVDGDLDEIGSWKTQAVVTIGAYVWHSEYETFKVLRNI